MSSLDAARDAASQGLGCHSFIPARSCEAQYDLLHALKVVANNRNEAGYDFAPLDVTMADGDYLAHTNSKDKYESLVKIVAAIKETHIEDSKQAIKDHTDASGSLSSCLPVSMGGGVSSDH